MAMLRAYSCSQSLRVKPCAGKPAMASRLPSITVLSRATPIDAGADRCVIVKAADMVGEPVQQGRAEFAALRDCLKQLFGRKAAHNNDLVHELACAETERAITLPVDASHLEIEVWRGSAVQFELGLTHRLSLLDGREIEIGILHQILELVGMFAGKKDQRGMGFDTLDRSFFAEIF
jgi:hypothetical protein